MNSTHLLAFRCILFVILLLQALYAADAASGLWWPWLLLAAYGAGASALFQLGRLGRLSPRAVLWTFALDMGATTTVLLLTRGVSSDFYIAYFLVILMSCLLENLNYSFIVGGAACLVYGLAAFPGIDAEQSPTVLLRLSLLLATSLFGSFMADVTRRVRLATAEGYEIRIAWMERLSLAGKAVSAVLHELKTPMNTIILSADFVKALAGKPDQRAESDHQLDVIAQEAERAAEILTDFLDYTSPSELRLEPVDAALPLREALERVALRLQDRGVELRAEVEDGLTVLGSERHLIQVFLNLIVNAVDAMPMGGRLGVSCRRAGKTAEVVLEDTGVGIDPEVLPGLFEPFSTTRAGEGGHGLGLHVVGWIVQKHGGRIRIDSAGRGKGSKVSVDFPLAAAS